MFKQLHITSIILLLCCNFPAAKGQNTGKEIWKTLSHLQFEFKWNENLGMKVNQAVFSKEILALNGKEVTVWGYLLPEKGYKHHKEFIISSLPYNLCYFCGKAGPETVMEVSSLDAVKYSQKPILLKGKLMLNVLDPMALPYILIDAKVVK